MDKTVNKSCSMFRYPKVVKHETKPTLLHNETDETLCASILVSNLRGAVSSCNSINVVSCPVFLSVDETTIPT